MLKSIRGMAQTWASKVIIVILALSFGVWGISDVFRGGSSGVVATVGETEIAAQTLANEFQGELQRLRARFSEVTSEQAVQMGIPQQILGQLVDQALVAEEARSQGLAVPDTILAKRIVSENPGLLVNGTFDRIRYENALNRSGQSLESFESGVRVAILRQQVVDAVAGVGPAPDVLATTLARRNRERRDLVVALVSSDDIANVKPDETAVQAYYDANPELFTAPEFRQLTLLELTADTVAGEIELSDDDIYAEYEDRIAEFEQPERRSVVQVLSTDETVILGLVSNVAGGQDFDAASSEAAEAGALVSQFDDVTRNGVPAEAAEVLFATPEGAVSEPVKTAFGWHVFKVKEVKPGGAPSFEEVRPALLADMTADIAIDSLYGLAGVIEDTLAGDGSLEDAADAVGVAPITIAAVDGAGRGKDGEKSLTDLVSAEKVLQAAFETLEGEVSDLRETEAGTYFIVRVDVVEEQTVQPLADIREQVIEGWRSETIDDGERLAAEALADEIRDGLPLAAAALGHGYVTDAYFAMLRVDDTEDTLLSPEILHGVFEADPESGEPVIGATEAGYVVAVVTDKHEAAADEIKSESQEIAPGLAEVRQSDMLLMFRAALQSRHEISVNGPTFEAVFASPSAQ